MKRRIRKDALLGLIAISRLSGNVISTFALYPNKHGGMDVFSEREIKEP